MGRKRETCIMDRVIWIRGLRKFVKRKREIVSKRHIDRNAKGHKMKE